MLRPAEELLQMLKQKPLTLDEAHERALASGSPWTRDQVELFLLCAPGVKRDEDGTFRGTSGGVEDELRAAIIEAVRSFAGRPATAAQVRSRLPSDFITTDEQVRAIAKRTPGLQIVGPGLLQASKGDQT